MCCNKVNECFSNFLNGLLMGFSKTVLTKKYYNYARSRKLTQVSCVKPVDGKTVYTDIEFGITHTF